MSFLSVFSSILHASEVAAAIAAPIVQTVDPTIGGLMTAATQAAVGVEAAVTVPGKGQQKAQLVALQTKAAVDVVNQILTSQGKPPLPANTVDVVGQQVGVVVANMNAIQQAVTNAPPASATTPQGVQ